jgi:amidase
MTLSTSPFFPTDPIVLPSTGHGPLDGITFAVKDVFDIAGHVTGAGNPDWLRTHPAAQHTAPVIEKMLAAGGELKGKTVTDELTYSLNGENWHYGTPLNPRAPGRIPGGSSSGSASAVASKLVDVALGTDCGGSIRLPSSYCGLYGIRPTHGRVDDSGGVHLAPSFDTAGWFADSAQHLELVGQVLLGEDEAIGKPRRLLIASDAFHFAGAQVGAALAAAVENLKACFSDVAESRLHDGDLSEWMQAFRMLQGREIWTQHGEWITREKPRFGPGIQERFLFASRITDGEVKAASLVRRTVRQRMAALLDGDTILCLPSAPGIAPMLNTPNEELEIFRANALRLLCPAGLAGLPQVSIPAGVLDGCPIGLSLVMRRGADRSLLDFVKQHDIR